MLAFLPPRCYLNLPAITPPPPSSWTSWSQWWVTEAQLLGNRQTGFFWCFFFFFGHHFFPLAISVFDGRKPIDIYQQNEPINKPTNFLQTHGKVFKLDPVNWIADLSSFYNRRKCHAPFPRFPTEWFSGLKITSPMISGGPKGPAGSK